MSAGEDTGGGRLRPDDSSQGEGRRRAGPSVLALALAGIIALVSVVGFAVTRRAAGEHDHQLLVGETAQAGELMENVVDGLYASMGSVATAARLAASDPQQFSHLSFPLTAHPGASIALLRRFGTGWGVASAVGTQYSPGQVLVGPVARDVDAAGAVVRPTAQSIPGGYAVVTFALGAPATPKDLAVYEYLVVPHVFKESGHGPASLIDFALYASPTADPAHLALSNVAALPTSGPRYETRVPIGDTRWLVVGVEKSPLAGPLGRALPWVILAAGLTIAVLVGITVDVIVRRRNYAEVQVALRTAELDASLRELHEAQDALVRRERLAAVGEMASVVGHELRNPLTAVTNALYLIRLTGGGQLDPQLVSNLDLAEREVGRANTLAQDLTDFVRPRQPSLEAFDLGQLLDEVLQATPAPEGISVRSHVERTIMVADRVHVSELLTNLITNAYQAMTSGGHVWVWSDTVDDRVRVMVQDDGPGIPPDVAAHIFDPFVTTKNSGTGLGLAIVRRIAEEHGGTVALEEFEGPGTRFVATFPVGPDGAGAP